MRSPLRLLYLPQCRPSPELGGSKVQLALADQLSELGWNVDILFPFDSTNPQHREQLSLADVVDWDPHHQLLRSWLPLTSLSICRFPLLPLHWSAGVPWPRFHPPVVDLMLSQLRQLLGRPTERQVERQALAHAQQALRMADAIAVQNSADRRRLLDEGCESRRIVVEPCGISASTAHSLESVTAPDSSEPVLSFVGSFDTRKGCLDLIWLSQALVRRFPLLRLRLIGTNGMHQGESAVRRCFPGWLQSRLTIIPTFPSARLADYLDGVTLGVFPSYLEGFGIAVIEQLAAAIPVMAYAAPGPVDILPAEWLAPRGDRDVLLQRVSFHLAYPCVLAAARVRARVIAAPYRWGDIASRWDHHYHRLLAQRQV
jgi:glycosyltransferase involved in cell wall biosynthesis